ncbi:MAG: 3-oxoacyl-ACP reductase FabG [Gammaproteobacteria bacterium]
MSESTHSRSNELDGQKALVTGASRGIGEAIAKELAARGAYVVGTATTDDGAQRIGARFAASGLAGAGMRLDVTDGDSVATLMNGLAERDVLPSILINNAGITRDTLLARMSESDWDAVIDTNLGSIYRLCKACARHLMKARTGRIVNVSSVVGATGNAGQTNYAAAKAGMIGFTRALARELGARGITVNAVAPGFVDTDMTRQMSADQREALLRTVPLGRLAEPEEIAAAVAFLVSPDAAYITGETLHVNGGMHMS